MFFLDDFLRILFGEGRVVLLGQPAAHDDSSGRAAAVLESAFAVYRLEVAGPLVGFDPGVAVAAALLLRQACWALISRDQRIEDLAAVVRMPEPPTTASHHLSADLVLRYLPQIHRRARGLDPSDPLLVLFTDVLRQWPLSGVLADLDEGPQKPPNLAGHPGLMLLYAERLAQQERPEWRPAEQAMEYIELVLADLGRSRSPLLTVEGTVHHG